MEKIPEIAHSEDEIKSLFDNGSLPFQIKQKQGTFILGKENNIWKVKEVDGASGDSFSKLAMDLAEKLLSKEDSLKLDNKIRNYQKGKTGIFDASSGHLKTRNSYPFKSP